MKRIKAMMEARGVPHNQPARTEADAGWLSLTRLWAGPDSGAEAAVPQVRWWRTGDRLVWEMKLPLPLAERDSFKTEGFVEGLWEQDVAEFFLADRRTGTYQEFNLSPGGTWWGASFTAPRVRSHPQPAAGSFGVIPQTTWDGRGWVGRVSMPLPDLSHAVFNFTAIVEGRAGRRFYSLAVLGGATPDFHQPGQWLVAGP